MGQHGREWLEGLRRSRMIRWMSTRSIRSPRLLQVRSLQPTTVLISLTAVADFYTTFWSLQLPFSKPPVFANAETFPEFRDAVNKVLPVIKEATAKDRAMMGKTTGASGSSVKRKREPDAEDLNVNEYFFAKFLTSPDLIDLEVGLRIQTAA